MNSQICRSAKSFISASSKQTCRAFSACGFGFFASITADLEFGGGRAAAAAATVSLRGVVPSLASYGRTESGNASRAWISGVLALPAAAYMLQEQEAHAAEMERTFIAIKPDGVQRGLLWPCLSNGERVIRYGRKLIGVTDPQKSEPGTIRGDLAVVVGRNIIHGSDGPETAKDEINLWFKPEELVKYTSNSEKWVYGGN
ncbi:hypothetical protein RND71_042998 [Anisodus tanguticus]|uniref:Nucleoside diphosphate kinase n=1 Tax=Anisodus tanguticus TaxID=243964 RepID=A0AAE1QS21_9SOLA|nr:hypothetical protein RND71_042998 [Anisodus tanguticus]